MKKIEKYLRDEKGAVTTVVVVTLLFFIIILSTAYMITATLRKNQLKGQLIAKETYERDLANINEIYDSIADTSMDFLNDEARKWIEKSNVEIAIEDIMNDEITFKKILSNEASYNYLISDKECMQIINNSDALTNLVIANKNITKEKIQELYNTASVNADKNKITNILKLAQIEKLTVEDLISNNGIVRKLINDKSGFEYAIGNENIIDNLMKSTVALQEIEVSNSAVVSLVKDNQALEKYNNSTTGVKFQLYDGKFTGNVQVYIAEEAGTYNIQCWGARGGYSLNNGSPKKLYGKGGYASGDIELQKGEALFVYVGGHGGDSVVKKNSAGGWNNGGLGTHDGNDDETSGGGGGATDIRLQVGKTDDIESLASRIMVAGAGGGASFNYSGGAGGGISGITSYSVSQPGTQTSGYKFGIGKDGEGVADSDGVAGGGAGYYGGYTSNTGGKSSGAGGSGYISGHNGCIAIRSKNDITPKVTTSTDVSDSYHYSGKIFTETVLLNGNETQPTFDNTSTMTGNSDDGYCKIMKKN